MVFLPLSSCTVLRGYRNTTHLDTSHSITTSGWARGERSDQFLAVSRKETQLLHQRGWGGGWEHCAKWKKSQRKDKCCLLLTPAGSSKGQTQKIEWWLQGLGRRRWSCVWAQYQSSWSLTVWPIGKHVKSCSLKPATGPGGRVPRMCKAQHGKLRTWQVLCHVCHVYFTTIKNIKRLSSDGTCF